LVKVLFSYYFVIASGAKQSRILIFNGLPRAIALAMMPHKTFKSAL